MPSLIRSYSSGFRAFRADTVELAGFGAQWPNFGPIRRDLTFTLDPIGDVVDLLGDDDLDPNGVQCLISEAQETYYRRVR